MRFSKFLHKSQLNLCRAGICILALQSTFAIADEPVLEQRTVAKESAEDGVLNKLLGIFSKTPTKPPQRKKITPEKDAQPSPPDLPEIGQFVDMPGTDGAVEFTRINDATDKNRHQHSYSRRAAIDPFNKYIILNGILLDLNTFEPIAKPPFSFEFVASNTEEDIFYGWEENKLRKWNAATGETKTIWTSPGNCCFTIGKYEGSISRDDKLLPVTWNENASLGLLNLHTGELTGSIPSSELEGDLNWLDVSPLGNFAVVGTSTGVYRYDTDFTNKLKLDTKHNGNGHADLALTSKNEEVIVQEGNYYDGDISYTILSSNKTYFLDVVETLKENVEYPNSAAHISAEAYGTPGRVLVSLQHNSGLSSIFTLDLKPKQKKVANWGHTYTTGDTYFTEAKATISRDGTMVIWTSNWMEGELTYEFLARVK